VTTLEVTHDAATLAQTVAERFVARLSEVQESGRVPAVALTGGTIADEIYRRVVGLEAWAVNWKRVEFYWGDERYVPADSSDRNESAARRAMLDPLGVDPALVHAMPATDAGHATLEDAALAYEEVVRTTGSGAFDLVLLGVGPDGHVASLFPGFPQLDVDDRIAVPVTGSPKPPPERISLTFPALNQASEVWFLVSGDAKADAVARALAPEGTVHATPARGIHPHTSSGPGTTTWFLDVPAASLL
jgi:6-phosphogluconolactonase